MKGTEKPKWTRAFGNEIGRLFQGIREIEVTKTCFFINKNEAPKGSKVTYSRKVCNIRPRKTKTHRVPLIVAGDKLSYEGPVSTPTADLTTSKLHWKSVMSTSDGKYLIVDVKNFYLKNSMNKAEYLKIAIKILLQEIINTYDLLRKQYEGYIYVIIEKGMYGMVQAVIIAQDALKEHLKPYGYAQENITQSLWTHTDRYINFTLVVDDFRIKYTHKKYADHLISSLQSKYEVTQEWTGGLYCRIKLK